MLLGEKRKDTLARFFVEPFDWFKHHDWLISIFKNGKIFIYTKQKLSKVQRANEMAFESSVRTSRISSISWAYLAND